MLLFLVILLRATSRPPPHFQFEIRACTGKASKAFLRGIPRVSVSDTIYWHSHQKRKSYICLVFKTQFAPDSLPNYDTYSMWTKTSEYIFFYSADFLGGSLRLLHCFRVNFVFFVLYNNKLIRFPSWYPGKPVESSEPEESFYFCYVWAFYKVKHPFSTFKKNTTNVFKADYSNLLTGKSCLIFSDKRNLYFH